MGNSDRTATIARPPISTSMTVGLPMGGGDREAVITSTPLQWFMPFGLRIAVTKK